MQVINSFDEKQRFMGVRFYENGRTEQLDSHGYSAVGYFKVLTDAGIKGDLSKEFYYMLKNKEDRK